MWFLDFELLQHRGGYRRAGVDCAPADSTRPPRQPELPNPTALEFSESYRLVSRARDDPVQLWDRTQRKFKESHGIYIYIKKRVWGEEQNKSPLKLGFKKAKPARLPWLRCQATVRLRHGLPAESTALSLSLLQVARKTESQ